MKALFVRLYRSTRVRGLVFLVAGGALAVPVLSLGDFEAALRAGATFGILIGAAVVIVGGAAKYRRSASTVGHEEVVLPLLRSGAEYCLVLRPFGQDAEIVLPSATGRRRRVGGTAFVRNVTAEQVVTTAARRVLDMATCGIVDQRVLLAPPGPVLVRASDDEWQAVARD